MATETAGQTAATATATTTATAPSALAVITPAATVTPPPPSPTILIYDYPGAPGHTPTPNPYPGGTPTPTITWTPGPTWTPEPTLGPTPVPTIIPTAAPPLIPFSAGTTAQPFTIYYRQGDAIYTLSSAEGAAPQLFLEPLAEFGHMLPPSARLVSDWGAFSPDGQSLALVLTDDPTIQAMPNSDDPFWPAPHPMDIYLFDVASRELRLLAADGFLPIWSPDGRRVAYRSTDTLGLWVVDVAGGAAEEVYAVPPRVDGEYAHFVIWFNWAYDSRRLIVLDTDIYQSRDWLIIDAGGAMPRPIYEDPISPINLPRWSPVADRLVFVRPGLGSWHHPSFDLWIMNGDLTGQAQLTHNVSFSGFGARWSSDGRWIAMSGLPVYESEYGYYDLWLIDSDSAAVYRLTYDQPAASYEERDDVDKNGPVLWSPDGTHLVYSRGSHQLWLMSLLDGSRRQLLQSEDSLHDSGIIVGR